MAKAVTSIRLREPSSPTQELELVDVDFGMDAEKEIEQWLHDKLGNYIESHSDLHKTKIPKMRRLYGGKPESETKSFPFANCSNVVVQVIGDRVDTLTARILGFIFATNPLWHFLYPAITDSPKQSERKRQLLEDFMDCMGYEPSELDLYRIYGQWGTEHVNLGTSFVKFNLEDNIESVATGYSDSKKTKRSFTEKQIYYGPKVEKTAHEDIFMDPSAQTVEKSRLVSHRKTLSKFDIQERVFTGLFDKKMADKILEKPDRYGPSVQKSKEHRKQGVQAVQSNVNAEWDVYECYFPWFHAGHKFRLIYNYHFSSRTVMRKVFSFVPDNQTPIVRAKLGYRNDGAYGPGFASLLEDYQYEASLTHNNRNDNSTLANTRFWRISSSATNIGSQIEIFPNAAITANKDEIEAIQMADVYQSSFQNETMTLELADQRSGIAPAVTGSGSGGPTKGKGNPYSAMGTLAAMQEGNHRTNLATSDFRHAHQRLGSMLTSMYAKFGIDGREKMFGKDGHLLLEALREFAAHKNRIPIRSTNASVNKEVEKQNDMLMVGLVQRHYTAQAQVMQAINNPSIPPPVRDYLTNVLRGADLLQKRILRDFGYDQPEEFIPDASETVKPQGAPNAPQDPTASPAVINALASAKQSMGQPGLPTGDNQGTPPQSGMAELPQRPQ